jgi:ATP synthase F1 gamma subunit
MLTQKPMVKKLVPVDYRAFVARPEAGTEGAGEERLPDDAVLEEVIVEEAPDDIFDEGDLKEELIAERGEAAAAATKEPVRPIYELLPDPGAALEKLISRRMATEVYRGMLESYAAELAARMTAMDNATANADEMVADLTLSYNRARQSGITTELLDIIGGANALG